MAEAHLSGMGIAVPHRVSTERFLEVDAEMRRRHRQGPELIALVKSLAEGTGIKSRYTIHPGWLEPARAAEKGAVEDIFTPSDFDPPLWQRLKLWRDHGLPLAVEAARKAIADWGGDPKTITHLITTGTSGWLEPGMACSIIEGLDLPMTVQKAELNFNGCFCGATCLRLGRDLVRAEPGRVVLVVALEVSSGHYNIVDTDPSTLVANTLFSDGAAAFVLSERGAWAWERTGMQLVPKTQHLLTFEPPMRPNQETYKMFLHREVGARLAAWLRSDAEGKPLVDALVDSAELPGLAIHPGGPRILDSVREVMTERGWDPGAMKRSFETLQEYGNLGAAALLFVLAGTLPHATDERIATFAFGPGVTVEWGVLRRVR